MSESSDVIARLTAGGYTVRRKEQWGSKHLGLYALRLRAKSVPFPAKYGFVHITVTDKHGDEGMRKVEEIGFERFGSGVSYNWVIDHQTDHTIYVGQPLGAKGTHTVNDLNVPGFVNNLNLQGHAVAYMGDVKDTVCGECVDTVAAIFAAEIIEGALVHDAEIYPHRKFAAKACPGDKLANQIGAINALVDVKVKDGLASGHRPNNVEKARKLLEAATAYAKAHKQPARAEALQVALDVIPEK